MSKLELTISTNYVRSWNIYEGLRELVQNAADANDIGYPMKITYNPNRKEPTLTLVNQGISLSRDSLLLGTTSKNDDIRQRGCFGEGMKLGWLSLLRAGLKVWIKSGAEKWVPTLTFSDTYQSELLTVETSKATYENCIKVEVRGLEPDAWKECRQRILFSPGVELNKDEYIPTSEGKILTREDLRGKLFVKGLWITNMMGEYWFGYDFNNLEVDRDRKLADPYTLESAIRSSLDSADIPIEDLWTLFGSKQWQESRIIAESYTALFVSNLAARVTEEFHSRYGSDCIPVSCTSQSVEAAQHGLRTQVVSESIRHLVEFVEGKYEDKKNARALEYEKVYSVDELDNKERNNFIWVCNLGKRVADPLPPISVVDFHGENILGSHEIRSGDIGLARKILRDRTQLVSALIHEIAHKKGDDGTVEHIREEERLFGELITKLSEDI
jgi:hypothetical protein